jgi:TonB family protein
MFLVLLASIFIGKPPASATDTSWQTRVEQRVQQAKGYPRSAVIRGAYGTDVMRVSVDGFGLITSYRIIQASSFDVLNREAEKTLDSIGQFEAAPDNKPRSFAVTQSWSKPIS